MAKVQKPKENQQNFLSKYRVLFSATVAILILLVAAVAIFWARGFKPNFKSGRIDRTGLIVATSIPTGAQVYLDNRLTSATNTNIAFLEPKTYKLKIQKDGYTTWEKEIEVRADLSVEVNALLFPLAPEIKPQTTTGASNPTLSPDGSKIIYGVPGERGGLFSLPMSDRPFPFRQDPRILAKNQISFDYSKATFTWDPESKQAVATFWDEGGNPTANLLVDTEKTDQEPRDITASLNATISSWQDQIIAKAQPQLALAPDSVKAATAEAKTVNSSQLTVDSQKPAPSPQTDQTTVNRERSTVNLLNYYPSGLIFSPDEEKILYKAKDGRYKVYDLKQKKEFTMPEFPDFINISWFPNSNHLIVAQKDQVSVAEADGTNKTTVYLGKFENGFVFAHPSGTRIIILTRLTQPEGTPPNLYAISLR